jgi:hypothetical protein
MHVLLAPFSALLRAIRRLAKRLGEVASHLARRVHGEAAAAWSRHARRMTVDRPYRRTLTVALAALTTTVLPHPAVAAALGAWLAEPPQPRWRTVEDDDEDEDSGPPYRGRLWDTLGQP